MNNKKKLGIVGGMGSRAGLLLFDKIIKYSPATSDQEFIEILIHNNSSIPDRTEAILYQGESPVPSLINSMQLFNDKEMDYVIMACITSYHFADQLYPFISGELLNPITLVKEYILKYWPNINNIGILATSGTIKSGLFQKEFVDTHYNLVFLDKYDQENYFMKSVYMKNGLKSAAISDEALELFNSTPKKLADKGAELLIGGCTEVQIMKDSVCFNVPYIDTMDITAQHAVRLCYDIDILNEVINIQFNS